ncbi:MAG: hypothetical protein JXA50_12235 [Deltaproteobacteria bacterium]|nr:hypothetical protein [Deltaproteobacteria bacterium]
MDEFIIEKNLEYVEDTEIGNFWGGVDTYNNMKWELFFEADKNGPTPKQLSQYKIFLADFDVIYENIKQHIAPQLPIPINNSFSDYRNLPVNVDIVTLKKKGSEADIELACCFYQKKFIFKKRLFFLVNIKNNQIVSVVPN